MATLTFVFAITSVLSTYLIAYNHEIQRRLVPLLLKLGFTSDAGGPVTQAAEAEHSIVFLGCFREASSILHELESRAKETGDGGILAKILVIDFNPQVLQELGRRGIKCLYGDLAHMDTLHHAHIHSARIVACTISDDILRGTTNLRLLRQARRLCPHARVITAADNLSAAIALYEQNADFVYIARLHSAHSMAELITRAVRNNDDLMVNREEEIERLKQRVEVLR